MENSTAILIFTQEVSKDASRKMLTPSKNLGLNKRLFQQLNHHINHITYNTELPVFRSVDLIVPKGTFGEQFNCAIQKVFKIGFEKIVCLGNDCPVINKTQIIDAAKKLQTTDTIVGPDQHGGVYLLGVSKKTFDSETFKQVEWKTDKMLESYLNNFSTQEILILETIADIHTFQELQNTSTSQYFIKFLLELIEKSYAKIQDFSVYLFGYQPIRFFSLRAPPIY